MSVIRLTKNNEKINDVPQATVFASFMDFGSSPTGVGAVCSSIKRSNGSEDTQKIWSYERIINNSGRRGIRDIVVHGTKRSKE